MNNTWNSANFNQPYIYNPYNNVYNGYANNRTNTYSPQTATPQQQQQSFQNNIIWVKGKENARSMQLAPNSTVILLDSEVGKFYIKTTDDIGLGKLRVFNYIEQPDIQQTQTSPSTTYSNIDLSNYVTRQELQEMIKEIKEHEQPVSGTKSSTK